MFLLLVKELGQVTVWFMAPYEEKNVYFLEENQRICTQHVIRGNIIILRRQRVIQLFSGSLFRDGSIVFDVFRFKSSIMVLILRIKEKD